jgi:hypothetical protein
MSDSSMSDSPLFRLAGPIAAATGALVAAVHFAMQVVYDRTDVLASVFDPAFRTLSIAYAGTFSLMLITLVAVYGRHARSAGTFGVVGLCAAIIGTMNLGADMWFEAFGAPWLVEVAPQLFVVDKAPIWVAGYLSSYLLFALGWMLFGLSCLRARVFPAAISVAIVLSGLVGFWAAMPPFGAPLGIALAALGSWLVRSDRAARRALVPAER